ncbi:MAG: hypothetical protein PHF00_07330 [Elusimicrobia bacterium]|nr:hypothetical protein [Elusimicrobiota bacterium]
MTSIWGDGWFYLSGMGLLVSSSLFLYLLGQYRSAVEESEESEEAPPALPPKPAEPRAEAVVTPIVEPAAQTEKILVLPAASGAPVPASAPAPAPAAAAAAPAPVSGGYTGPERRRSETTTGGISPAVVYLQNIKAQLEKFDKEIAAIKGLMSQQNARGEQLLERLEALAAKAGSTQAPAAAAPCEPAVQAEPEPRPLELAPPAAVAAPAPEQPDILLPPEPAAAPSEADRALFTPAPAAAVPEAKTETFAPPAPEAKTEVLPLTEPEAPPQAAAPVSEPPVVESLPQSSEPAAEISKPRKGPVWPV